MFDMRKFSEHIEKMFPSARIWVVVHMWCSVLVTPYSSPSDITPLNNCPIKNHIKVAFKKLFVLTGASQFLMTAVVIEIIHSSSDSKKGHVDRGNFSGQELKEYTLIFISNVQ